MAAVATSLLALLSGADDWRALGHADLGGGWPVLCSPMSHPRPHPHPVGDEIGKMEGLVLPWKELKNGLEGVRG